MTEHARLTEADLPSQEELEQLQHLTTYTGASLKQLMNFRNTVLHAAAEKQRAFLRSKGTVWTGSIGQVIDHADPEVQR
jgi:hypothetical protein